MIKCEVNKNNAFPIHVEIDGDVEELANDVVNVINGMYDSIHRQSPEDAELFRKSVMGALCEEDFVWARRNDRVGSMAEDQILAVVKEPGEEARLEAIWNSLEDLQAAVGGYIETVTVADDLVLIVNEEGRLKGLPANCRVLGHDLVGTVVAVGVKGEEFCSLSPSALETAMELLGGEDGR